MLQFAICDDDIGELEHTHRLVESYLKEKPELDAGVRRFQSSYDLLDAISKRGRYDLYLLDILMPYINGIEVGEAIRKKDAAAVIVYLSSSRDYAVESYHVRAGGYLLKPFGREALFPLLDEILVDLAASDTNRLIMKTTNRVESLPLNQILYTELNNRRLCCAMLDAPPVESILLREGLDQMLAPLLSDGRFLKISASCVVNMQYIRAVTADGFQMSDGRVLTITRGFSDTRQKYMEYILERGMM
jgi:two-component system LytT family response regulator